MSTAKSPSNTVAGVDVGYCITKSVNAHREHLQPSVIGASIPISYKSGMSNNSSGLEVTFDGRQYFVGELAQLQSPDPVTPQARERSLEIVKILALTSLYQIGSLNPARLVTGLPVSWYAEDEEALEDALLGNHDLTINGKSISIKIPVVTTMPQPVGTIFYFLINNNGFLIDTQNLRSKEIAVIDFGMYTTDAALLNNMEYVEQRSQSVPVAGGAFYEMLGRGIRERYNRVLKPAALEKCARSGVFTQWGKEIRVQPEIIAEAFESVRREVIDDFLIKRWPRDEAKGFAAILVTGGNGPLFYDAVCAVYPSARLVEESQLANARGFYRFGLLKERQKKERQK